MNKEERYLNGEMTEVHYQFVSRLTANRYYLSLHGEKFVNSPILSRLEDVLQELEDQGETESLKRLSE